MKTSITLLLVLVLTGWVTRAEDENGSLEASTDRIHPDPLLHGQEEEEDEEKEEEKKKRGIDVEGDTTIEDGTRRGRTDSGEESEGARLPKPEALQGGPQALQGLHIGRIPHSCALCSRERNLCRIISGIFTRSPLPYGYSLVTPIPAGVCNLSITEMKPSKNFFALRRPDGTYVLNGNWDIQAAGQYLIGGTTFTYTPSDDNHGEQLAAPGPLTEPIELALISQSPNPGIKYEYRVPVQEYLGGTPTGLGPQTGGRLPNMGGIRGGLGPPPPSFPQGTSNIGSRNPNLGIRNPNTGSGRTSVIPGIGSQPLVPGRIPYGPNNPNIVAGNFGSLNPGIAPTGGLNRGRGLGGFNPSNVPVQRGSSQSGIGHNPVGSQGRNPTFGGSQPRVPLNPSESLGSRGSSGIPGVLPHGQPITPLGTSSQSSSGLPLPWNPSYGSQDGSQLSVGSPYLPNQAYPRVPASGSLPSGVGFSGQGLPGQQPGDSARSKIPGSGNIGVQGFIPPRDGTKITGIPPKFPENSVPLRPVAIPRPFSPGVRRPANIPGRSRRPQSGERGHTNPATPVTASGTHRTRHQHGGKRRQGHRKASGTSSETTHDTPFGIGIQQTQPNISPSSSASANRTILQTPAKGPRRRGSGGRRRQQQNDSGSTDNGGRRKNRTGRRKQRSRYQWAEKGFTPCSKSCGGGNQTTILSCERRRKKSVVPDRRCNHLPRPKTHTIMCNLKPCPAAWAPGEWGPCSVTCGMGVQTRPLVCKQQISPTFTMMVPEGACLSPPTVSTSQVCEMGRCPSTSPEWDTGHWSNCSAPCGLGSRTREVRCILGGRQVSDDTCGLDTQPEREQVCDMGSCATNTWFFSEWSEKCSESCGTGVQTRKVHCLISTLESDGDCPSESRPEASRTCRGDSGCGGQWFVGPWGECSSVCGIGRETRSVICVIVTRKGKWRVVDDDQCTSQSRPHDSQECNVDPCTPQWYTSDWSQCSASCEGGVMRREVTCLDATLRPSADCLNASKPASREPCHLHPCTTTTTTSSFYSPTISPSATSTFTSLSEGSESQTSREEGRQGGDSKPQFSTDKKDGKEDPTDDQASEEIENELVVEEISGSALNVIPDKDAQGDESVAGDEDEEEEREREDEEAEKKKKRKRKKNKADGNRQESEATGGRGKEQSPPPPPPPTERTSCIDRIKNCHLVFRARLCRLKYYNKLCCRTCSTS